MNLKRSMLSQRAALPSSGAEPWWGEQADEAEMIVALGGWDGSRNLASFEEMRPKQEAWKVMGNMSAAAAMNGQIWVVGGWDGQAYLKAVEVYDVATGRWSQVKSMLEPRCYAAMAVMDGKLYVAGGYYGQVNLDSVEVYDPASDEWTSLPRMACPRRGLGLAALNGHLYAVGGWDGKHNLASVESFSSMTGTWRRVPELAHARSSVAVNGGSLFAIGGWDGKNFLSSVECYAPIYGTVRNPVGEWRMVAPMNVPRSYASAVALGNRILVLGGWDGTDGRGLDSVEAYDARQDKWIRSPSLTCPRYGLAAVVVSPPSPA